MYVNLSVDYLAALSSTATGASILFLLVSAICPLIIISSRIMWAFSRLNMIWHAVKDYVKAAESL